MEQLPNIARERLKTPAGGDHLDADLLTAFAEQALPNQERSRVLSHLSRCGDCRDILALAVPPAAAADSLDTARPARWFQWKVLRWGAAAACVVIVGSAVLLRRDTLQPQSAKIAAVREEPKAELDAYQRVDQDAATKIRAGQATSSAMQSANEGLVKTGDQALKRPTPPKSLPPVAAPMEALSPGILEKKQVVVGGMHGSVSGGAFGAMAAKPEQNLRQAPVPTLSDESKPPAPEASGATELASVGKSSQVIEVEAATSAVDTETPADKKDAPGRAKAPSSAMLDAMTPPAVVTQNVVTQNKETRAEETVSQKMDRAKLYRAPLSRWTISSDGRLQHSIDAGQTWEPVTVAEKASFRALSANGPDVWVGGAAGLLYHSADSGASWTQVKPATAKATLTADIAAIEFTDRQHGKITTSTGDVWTTEDAGRNWRNQ